MKKDNVEISCIYAVKISNKIQPVQIISIDHRGGYVGKNINTGRFVRLRSAAKLRYKWQFATNV